MSQETNTTMIADKPQPVHKGILISVAAFVVIGLVFAQPCLCVAGAVVGSYKSMFYLIVVVRLLYGILMRRLNRADYLLWVLGFILFCIIAENLH